MSSPILLLAPGAAANLAMGGAPSGAAYISNQYGVITITNGSAADEAALIAAGCTALAAAPVLQGDEITVTTATYQLPSDGSTYFDINNTSGGAITLTLPVSPTTGQIAVITDTGGNAGTYTMTIQNAVPATVDSIATNKGWSKLRWNGANWIQTG